MVNPHIDETPIMAEQGQISPVTCAKKKCAEYYQHQFAGTIYYVWDMKELVMFLKVLSENVQFVVKSLQPVNLYGMP